MWKDSRALESASAAEAELAGIRGEARFSLSPVSFLGVQSGTRVALPSPNGATLSLCAEDCQVVSGCLRNAEAVATIARSLGERILVVPAGEQWPDGSLRPCLEDWLGAGAVLDAFPGELSPEADMARTTFRSVRSSLPRLLRECVSGQELIRKGFPQDVELGIELNVSDCTPILQDGEYLSA
jgi:2-phosphosulfolactate phosphatase